MPKAKFQIEERVRVVAPGSLSGVMLIGTVLLAMWDGAGWFYSVRFTDPVDPALTYAEWFSEDLLEHCDCEDAETCQCGESAASGGVDGG